MFATAVRHLPPIWTRRYYCDLGDCAVVGSSPEALVKLSHGRAQLRPIAGTRPRGRDADHDARLQQELLADSKENAEHVMLVDLARNDLGRVARTGTVEVNPYRSIERYSHVMHRVSCVKGELAADQDAFDLFAAAFPAGTLGGAPKVRAMELIDELEPVRRGFYGGTVGYFGHGGDMDQAITIRTKVFRGDTYSYQAGAGLVADSVPPAEYVEVMAKGEIVRRALALAEGGAMSAAQAAARLLLIDNYDSFTYNLVQAFRVLGAEVLVYRNDQITLDEACTLAPTHLCISPGPGTPHDAGVSMQMIAAFAGQVPILGVCLGHQSLVAMFGGRIVRAARLMHGKTSLVHHDGRGILAGMPQPFEAGRYHSLIVQPQGVPDVLEVSARTDEGEIMAVRHRKLAVEGVQFHPESVLTPQGPALLSNFLQQRSAGRES